MHKYALTLLITLLLATSRNEAQAVPSSIHSPIQELTQFFESYAEDLRQHRREAIVARYDANGSYRMGGGVKQFMTHDHVRSLYLEKWRGPKAFVFREITFEVLSSTPADAWAFAVGRFEWTAENGSVAKCSYTGVLRRRDGKWYIRVEDESCERK